MSAEVQEILDRALKLPAADKARLVGELLASLDKPDEAIDDQWRKEVEDRLAAYAAGELRAVSPARTRRLPGSAISDGVHDGVKEMTTRRGPES